MVNSGQLTVEISRLRLNSRAIRELEHYRRLGKLTSNVFKCGVLVLRKSGQHGFRLLRSGFALSIAFVLLSACFARERGPRVEVVCPSPPIPVTIGKNRVLVYELHLTNFDVVPLTLKRISIVTARENPEPLITLEGDKLSAVMIRIGTPMMMTGPSSAGKR